MGSSGLYWHGVGSNDYLPYVCDIAFAPSEEGGINGVAK